MESKRHLLQRIAHVIQCMGDKLNALQDECDRLSAAHWRSGRVTHPEWDAVFAKSEELRLRYVRMRGFYLKTAVRFARRTVQCDWRKNDV